MSAPLLIELGTEELPARFVPRALDALGERVVALLDEAGISRGAARTLGTPRRLTVIVDDVERAGPSEEREMVGPPASVAFDADDRPTKAALGFARKQGVDAEQLARVTTERGEYCAVRVVVEGAVVTELCAERLPALILGLPFAKSMRFGDPEISFGRPLRWILALHGATPISFRVGPVESGATTRPHRFHADPSPRAVDGPERYAAALAEGGVIPDPAERRRAIVEGARRLAGDAGGRLVEDEELADEVSFLVEAPYPLLGSFEESFLEVPREVLLSAMRSHQRYFSVEDTDGRLMARFVTVAGTPVEDPDVVRAGNERVLRARLADARYFFDVDRRTRLEDRLEELGRVVYHAKLGSSLEKTERTRSLAAELRGMLELGDAATLDRAALLSKTDLTTEMVGEFPDLQGVMGMHYARSDGEPEAVANAIREHYLPRFAGDELPTTDEGAILAVADRVETLAGSFGLGEVPTGAADPFGLRRRAIGVIAILLERGWRVDLAELVRRAVDRLGPLATEGADETVTALLDFFGGRLTQRLLADGLPADAVDAALAVGLSDVHDTVLRARALAAWKARDDAAVLQQGLKRVSNILRKQGEGARPSVDTAHLGEDAERALADALGALSSEVAHAVSESRYDRALDLLVGLTRPIDRFFDEILVMADDPEVRNARLGLLAAVADAFGSVGDLTRIQLSTPEG